MDFTNTTDFPADSLVGSTGDREQTAMVACKVTYGLAADGSLEPVSTDQMWPVQGEPASFEGVTLLPDLEFRKKGIDILVFGEAVAPRGGPPDTFPSGFGAVPSTSAWKCSAIGYGSRIWEGSSPPNPNPSRPCPSHNERAFGGSALLAEAEIAHSTTRLVGGTA